MPACIAHHIRKDNSIMNSHIETLERIDELEKHVLQLTKVIILISDVLRDQKYSLSADAIERVIDTIR